MLFNKILLLTALFVVMAASQVKYPDYKTYKEAADAANATRNTFEKEDAWRKALALSKTQDEKFDAILGLGSVLEVSSNVRKVGGGKGRSERTVVTNRLHEAFALYKDALAKENFPKVKQDELNLRVLGVVVKAYYSKDNDSEMLKELASKEQYYADFLGIMGQNGVSTQETAETWAKGEYKKIIDDPATSPDIKAKAYIGLSKIGDAIYNTEVLKTKVGYLKSAAEVPGAADDIKAFAYLEIANYARNANDVNTFAQANALVTKLPKATKAQKLQAFDGVLYLLVLNKRIDDAQKYSADSLLVAGATNKELAKFHCYRAFIELMKLELMPQDMKTKKIESSIRSFAGGELEKSVAGLTPDEKVEQIVENGKLFRSFQSFAGAHEQFNKALAVKQASDKEKAIAQYEIAETFAAEGKKEEAKQAYAAVSNTNPQYYGYAQERVKKLN